MRRQLRLSLPGLHAFACLPAFTCLLAGLVLFRAGAAQSTPGERPASIVLHGTLRPDQNHTYVELPFAVPAGTRRITLTFSYTGKAQHTAVDLGLLDPEGLRCWSGGNKTLLTISPSEATPSCLPGPLPAGTWKVLLGVPNLRRDQTSEYTASLFFDRTGLVQDEPPLLTRPLRTGPAWYRGDLHMHTAHSDGSCASQSGKSVPCPVYLTVEAAARRGLDFIAITDHNTSSHYDAMRELTPYFDHLLLVPGREITSFHGHANLFGTEDFLDFRLGTPQVPDINTLLRNAQAIGGLISLNHPGAPTGEICMGCGWDPSPAADMRLVQAVEAVNSGAEEGPYSGIPFWERELNQGFRLTAIGGSDNHNATKPLDKIGSVGSPTTVIYATELSTPAVLAGLRAGHVFIDLTASRDKLLELTATSQGRTVSMGDALDLPEAATLRLSAHIFHAPGSSLLWIEDGKPLNGKGATVAAEDEKQTMEWTSDHRQHWFRAEVRGPDGHLWLLGNPIFVNWRPPQGGDR